MVQFGEVGIVGSFLVDWCLVFGAYLDGWSLGGGLSGNCLG